MCLSHSEPASTKLLSALLAALLSLLSAAAAASPPPETVPDTGMLEERGCGLLPCDSGWPERGWSRSGESAWSLERAITLFGFNPFDPRALRQAFSNDLSNPGGPVPPPPVTPPVEPPVTPPVDPPVDPPVEPPVDPPVEPPVQPPMLVVTGDTSIAATHVIGPGACPQELGRFTLANTGGGALNYTLGGAPGWLELVTTSGQPAQPTGSLAPGAQTPVVARFTCSGFGAAPAPGESRLLSADVTVRGEAPGGASAGSRAVSINLTLQN
ncbi:MAG: hypothetical protein KDI09_20465 [Halioglobus sp.]|nr:hypothetical protein [Halioglobus sp.]